jgi:hypothetical protein
MEDTGFQAAPTDFECCPPLKRCCIANKKEAVAKHEDLKVQWTLLLLSNQIEAAAIINQVGAITTKLKGFEELTLQPSMYIEVLEKEKKDVEHRCEYVRSVNAKLIEPTAV